MIGKRMGIGALLALSSALVWGDMKTPEGFVALFDGESMEGWFFRPPVAQTPWKVDPEKGTLGRVIRGGYIWTEKTYGDFELMLEYKLSRFCNSGVFFRAMPEDPVQNGLEIQLIDSWPGLRPKQDHGALYDAKAASSNPSKKHGEWNEMRIRVQGKEIKVWINGTQILEADLSEWTEAGMNPDGTENKYEKPLSEFPLEGHIGFQDHGHNVWFRNIFLKEL